MTYELAKQLEEAGFRTKNPNPLCETGRCNWVWNDNLKIYYEVPTLSELIEACGKSFAHLVKETSTVSFDEWYASDGKNIWKEDAHWGKSPEEAVAKLWLALYEKETS